MADDYNDIESAVQTVLRADSAIQGLVGSIIENSGATLNEGLDASETGVDYTGTNPSVNDIWKIDDELMLVTSVSAPTATVTREYQSTTGAEHDTGIKISRKAYSIFREPKTDFREYRDSELPIIAFFVANSGADEIITMGKYDKSYIAYLEVYDQGVDISTPVQNVKRIMSEVERVMREQKDSSTPFSGTVDDVSLQGSQLIRGRTEGTNEFVALMTTNIEFELIGTS